MSSSVRRSATLLLAALLLGSMPGASAGANDHAADSVTTTTVVPAAPGDASLSQIPDNQLPAVEQFAREYGLTLDRAWEALIEQAELTDYADSVRSLPGYGGFRVTMASTGEVRGVLAVTDPSAITVPPGLPVTLVVAALPESSIPSFSAAMTATLSQEDLQAPVVAVTYDPFQGEVIVWSSARSRAIAVADVTTIGVALQRALPSPLRSARVRVDTAPSAGYSYGGLKEFKTGSFLWFHWTSGQCTSAFGVVKSIGGTLTGDYLTAAHCKVLGGTGWKVAHPSLGNQTVNAYYNSSFGGYKDRIVFQANGASYLTKTSSSTTEDMTVTATHIYVGTWYCHYGSRSNVQQCGTIQQVNVPITDQGYTVYASLQQYGRTCIAGDSGGPVWRPGSPSTPAGTIEGYSIPDSTCMYLALDDQLSGSGWVLL